MIERKVRLVAIRKNLLFNELHFTILSRCNYTYAHKISKGLDATWTSVVTILREFEELQLIKRIKQGRVYMIDLTPLGKELVSFYNTAFLPLTKQVNDINDVVSHNIRTQDDIDKMEGKEDAKEK